MDKSILESSEFYDKRFSNFSTMIIIPVTLLVILVVIFSLFCQREITIQSGGQVDSGKAVPIIQSTSNNKIIHNYLKEGHLVHKGKPLVTYQSDSINRQLDLLRRQNDLMQQQISALETLKTSIQQNRNLFFGNDKFGYEDLYNSYSNQRQVYLLENSNLKQKSSQENSKKSQITNNINSSLQINQSQLNSYIDVISAIKSGIRPRNSKYSYIYQDYEKQNRDLSEAERSANKEEYLNNLQQHVDQLRNTIQSSTQQKIELENFDSNQYNIASNNQKILSLQNEQLKSCSESKVELEQKKDENNLKIKSVQSSTKDLEVKAPISGMIHILNPDEHSKLIGMGNPIAQVYPVLGRNKFVKIKSYVEPRDISTIKKGQKLRLKIIRNVSTPIILEGKIETISVAPVTINKSNFYVVEALARIPTKQSNNLHYGMVGQGSIITGKESFFAYYKNYFLGQSDQNN
ncbi:bacteriocin secretion accessory protein [Lactobacillus sp. DCY120]|uniref:Bacteriocin secretion accessory protein n=1 Tax=Bombilactobacillus apium TaxID=2675299 RepID=A0A850R6T3_9LACO|nr:bacteriocin secretion accessory protein [Bombilactobacillus apium]NVY96537.1 bacteriocin secretion accessory protein [Bombilactobacillus apium]